MLRKNVLLPIFLVVLLDLIGVGIIIPVLAPMFIAHDSPLLPPDTPLAARSIVFGLLLSIYPIALFFGAPILGALSDKHGRRKVLMITITATAASYILFGAGILMQKIPLLFLSRALAGFAGGNVSVAMSAVADISDEKSKPKNFGIIGMAFGFGFIIGPFIGGKLADSTVLPWFNFATPFWFAALLSALNFMLVARFFSETLNVRSAVHVSPLTGFRNLAKAASMPNLRILFLVIFLYWLGFNFFTQFFQAYMVEKFSYNQGQIGDLFAYIGLWIIFTQGVLVRLVSRFFSPEQTIRASLLALSIAMAVLLLPSQAYQFFILLPFVSVSNGLTFPNSTALVSGLAGKESQGEIMGITQSVQAAGLAIPPIISGFIFSMNEHLPIIAASGFLLLAWAVFSFGYRPRQEKFHEV
ncbi:MFS transporter [Candidatus Woesearchaeota archaeon]|nr:MFS transporter [Candidatus Woesearchaeota archaeon]